MATGVSARIRAKIAAGRLPVPRNPPGPVWVSNGRGRPCDACDQPITASEVDHEVDLPSGLHFHQECFTQECFTAWHQESLRNGVDGPASSERHVGPGRARLNSAGRHRALALPLRARCVDAASEALTVRDRAPGRRHARPRRARARTGYRSNYQDRRARPSGPRGMAPSADSPSRGRPGVPPRGGDAFGQSRSARDRSAFWVARAAGTFSRVSSLSNGSAPSIGSSRHPKTLAESCVISAPNRKMIDE